MHSITRKTVTTLAATTLAASFVATAHADVVHQWDAANDTAGDGMWEDTGSEADTNFDASFRDTSRNAMTSYSADAVSGSATNFTHAYTFTTHGADNDFAQSAEWGDDTPAGNPISGLAGSNTSWEVWFKPDAFLFDEAEPVAQTLFSFGGGKGLAMYVYGNAVGVSAGKDGSGSPITLASGDVSSNSDFIQGVLTIDDETGDLTSLYINGSLVDTAIIDGTLDYSGPDVSGIGRNHQAGGGDNPGGINGGDFAGQIARINIHDTALSAAEVEANYLAVIPEPATLALVGLGGLMLAGRRHRTA
ncbi:MAG: LamG-like jellyroll fold domain-containing protein [Phycisphaeraceae bacterium]